MLNDLVIVGYVLTRSALDAIRRRAVGRSAPRRLAGDAAEGVISTAIAVLIVAFLGAAMYLVFRNLLDTSGSKANDQVNQIGGNGGGG